jgi:hypothetical protein
VSRLIVGRALGIGGPLVGGLVAVVLWRLVPDRAFSVFGQGAVEAVVWPLVPTVFAAFVPASTVFADRTLERLAPRPGWTLRARSVAAVLAIASVVVALSGRALVVPARNTALLLGIAYLSAFVVTGAHGWMPVVTFPVVCWLVGTRSSGLHAPWALLLRPPGDRTASMVSLVALALGVAAFVVVGRYRRA